MLALVHHLIVQYAAFEAGKRGWFRAYAILGDDVVIANREVARQYRAIMKGLGVRLSGPKTLIGRGSCEFAKRFFLKGKDASPVSLLEFALGRFHLPIMVDLVRKLKVVWEPKLSRVVRAAGFGYRVQGRISNSFRYLSGRIFGLLVTLASPGVCSFSSENWVEFLKRILSGGSENLYPVYQCIRDKVSERIRERIEEIRSSVYAAQSEALTLDGFDVYWWAVIFRRLYVRELEYLDKLERTVNPLDPLDLPASEMIMGNHECIDSLGEFLQGWWSISDELAVLRRFESYEDRGREKRYRSKEGKMIRLWKSVIRASRPSK